MLSPRVLINLSIFVALIFTALFVLLLWLTPYTGFNVEKDPASDYMLVTRVDNWVASQGLKTGDKINLISAGGDSITLSQKHVLTSTFQARALYENRKERLNELAKVYRIVSQPVVTLDLVEGRQIDIAMDQRRPLSSISVSVWIRFFLGPRLIPLLALLACKFGSKRSMSNCFSKLAFDTLCSLFRLICMAQLHANA